jgi:plasmid stabilization system protein ParE
MDVRWTEKALSDLTRLYEFLAPANKSAAVRIVRALSKAPNILRDTPRIGEVLHQFEPREVRHIFAGDYEIRYEVRGESIFVLRIWHMRESR